MSSAVDALPIELCELITSRLQPGALRHLCATSQRFGQQPTNRLATRLTIALPDLQCLPHSRGRLSRVVAVTVTGDKPPPALFSSGRAEPILFVIGLFPSLARLTKLTLHHLPFCSIITTAANLPTGCPQLTCLELNLCDASCHQQLDAHGQPHLWPALAAAATLRRLKLRPLQLGDLAGGGFCLSGIGAVTQLHSLSIGESAIHLSDLLRLVGLTQLTLGSVSGLPPPPSAPGVDVGLSRLSQLRCLKLRWDHSHHLLDLPFLHAVTACRGLAALRVDGYTTTRLSLVAPSFTQLVTLRVPCLQVDCTELATMQQLREVDCLSIVLPAAGAGVALRHVSVVDCGCFSAPPSGLAGDHVPPAPQPVAQTFPDLTALKWHFLDPKSAPADSLWPVVEGQLLRCHTLSLPASFPLPLARCAVAVKALSVSRGPAVCRLSDLLPALLAIGPHLQRIELCNLDTGDADLAVLAAAWTGVEDLTLRGDGSDLTGVTDAGLATLSRLPRLRRVCLVRCSAVTPAGVAALAERWLVDVVEVCGCSQVGAADVARLHELLGLPQLDLMHRLVEAKAPSSRNWLWAA